MVEILQRHCQISSFVFAAGWMASEHLPLPLWANLHVSPETARGHTLRLGFTGFNSNINQRRFIMAVQTFALGNVVIMPNALGHLEHAGQSCPRPWSQSAD